MSGSLPTRNSNAAFIHKKGCERYVRSRPVLHRHKRLHSTVCVQGDGRGNASGFDGGCPIYLRCCRRTRSLMMCSLLPPDSSYRANDTDFRKRAANLPVRMLVLCKLRHISRLLPLPLSETPSHTGMLPLKVGRRILHLQKWHWTFCPSPVSHSFIFIVGATH